MRGETIGDVMIWMGVCIILAVALFELFLGVRRIVRGRLPKSGGK